ncbi:MAG: phospholipase D-like domain-containing protein, partial [Eubacteriales bacterium]
MKKILTKLFSRMSITVLLLIFQISWSIALLVRATQVIPWINGLFSFIGLCTVLYIINRDENPSYKIAWIIPIFIFPLFGVIIYLLYGNKRQTKHLRRRLGKTQAIIADNLHCDEKVLKKLSSRDASRANYLQKCGYPVYDNTETMYFPSGEEMYPKIIEAISSAKRFIFLEYFIIAEGEVWNSILEILEQKAKEGVDVRIIYDDVGCLSKIPTGYFSKLTSKGIKSMAFNPFVPIVSAVMNNRDHRKILVVDGNTAFTGGINLADEYMNITHPFGYWKDTGIMLRGKAVWSLTCMFLQMWGVIHGIKDDFEKYRPDGYDGEDHTGTGIVQI